MTAAPVLSVRDLSVQVATPAGAKTVVDGLSFDLHRGATLALAGESGSGKSMTAMAVMGLLPRPMARISGGSIRLGDTELTELGERALRKVRAARIAMIFQEPMTSLNPVLRIGTQLVEVLREHRVTAPGRERAKALDLLRDVRLTDPEKRLDQYPHELSGGMRQRVMIAMALACDPEVLIADEPTTALDVTVQAEILALIRRLAADHGSAVLMITHDMGVVAQMADRVVVLREGRVEEASDVESLFSAPTSQYARDLLAAVPRLGDGQGRLSEERPDDILRVEDLSVHFDMRGGFLGRATGRVHAVERVSFGVAPGETLALVGESGCGKSTIGKALCGLVPFEGSVVVDGQQTRDLSSARLKAVRRNIQMIWQDPGASLDARMRIGPQIAEPMTVHGLPGGRDRVAWLLERVGLPADAADRYPHEFSGGQRQRICIARALALSPRVIVADEPTSALDVSVQAQVLDLLSELQDESGLAMLFVSHDMAVVDRMADRVAVMRLGQIVEVGPRDAVLRAPAHPYTRRLIEAVPEPVPGRAKEPPPSEEQDSPLRPIGDPPPPLRLAQVATGHWAAV